MQQKSNKKIIIFFILILLIGFATRIYKLDNRSIWYDEGMSMVYSLGSFKGAIESGNYDYSPPLYFILLHIWSSVFGTSIFVLRLFSVILGIGSIILLYIVGARLFNKNVGLLSSFLLSISIFHIYYSREIRQYSLLVFLTLLSFYFFITFEKTKKGKYLILNSITNILLIYTHIFAWFILIIQNSIIFYKIIIKKIKIKKILIEYKDWLISQGIVIISFIPFIPNIIRIVSNINASFWIKPVKIIGDNIYSLSHTLRRFSNNYFLLFFYFGIIIISCIMWFRLNNNKKHSNSAIVVIFWMVIPFLVTYLYSLISPQSLFTMRYFIISLPAFYLLISVSMTTITSKKYIFVIMIGIIIISSGISMIKYHERPIIAEDYRSAVFFVKEHFNYSKDIVLSDGTETFAYYFNKSVFSDYDDITTLFSTLEKQNIFSLDSYLQPKFAIRWKNKPTKNIWIVRRYVNCTTLSFDFLGNRTLQIEQQFLGMNVCYFTTQNHS